MFYHFGADIQKHTQLKYQRPRSLITEGLFEHCRNPNYFGEIMIYMGFAMWSGQPFFVVPCFLSVWLLAFVPNMLAKEASMSRYKEWDPWVARTSLVFPSPFRLVWDFCEQGLCWLPSAGNYTKA